MRMQQGRHALPKPAISLEYAINARLGILTKTNRDAILTHQVLLFAYGFR